MVRAARIVIPGVPHHIVQRGNDQQDVFFIDEDRRTYLDILQTQAGRYGLSIEGYCLMTNHVHIVGIPTKEDSLSKAIGRTHFTYTQYINQTRNRSGHLWQNRYHSCAMDETHASNALSYVELNPVRAGIIDKAWDYPWSSAAAHCGQDPYNPVLDLTAWNEQMPGKEWRSHLRKSTRDKTTQDTIRHNTHTGRPLGSESFLDKMEHLLGRRIRPLPVGRPKGWRKPKA